MANPLASVPTATNDSARIEKFLAEAVTVDGNPYLTQITSHLVKAGGKRQRPRFTIAAAAAGAGDGEVVADDVVRGGVAVELIQVGSLYHDDVLDEAKIRRQVESVNARWGNQKAILAGDYLLAKASEIAASLGTEVAGLLATTITQLCQGQVHELQTLYDCNRTTDQYFSSIAGKTASLFATSTRTGAIVAGHSRDVIDTLTEFGRLYGIAFQIIDDILDVVASEEQVGKPTGQDIVEGVYSLPVLNTLALPEGDELRGLLHRSIDEQQRQKALDIVRSSQGLNQALKSAESYVEQAREKIFSVSTNVWAQALADTASALLTSEPIKLL